MSVPEIQDEVITLCSLADLFLDTLPCNAHTTASDALWSAVLTCLGTTFAGRVAASLLEAAGCPSWSPEISMNMRRLRSPSPAIPGGRTGR